MTPDDPLLTALKQLPRELSPEEDLWPGLAARLTPRHASTPPKPAEAPWWWGLSAAAAILVIALGAGQLAPQAPPGTEGAALLQAGAQQLEAVLAEQRDEMDPELYLIVSRSLGEVEDAIGRIEAALAGDPDDPRLQEALESLQRRRVALLRTAVNL
ncbi:MAG: hypothetical protein ACI8S6_005721 [Myxococcota bacterium]|jgi:hypothetical protein